MKIRPNLGTGISLVSVFSVPSVVQLCIVFFIAIYSGCRGSLPTEVTDEKGKIPCFDLSKISDTVDLSVNDLQFEARLVRVDPTGEIMIGDGTKTIVAKSENARIFQRSFCIQTLDKVI